MSVGVLAISMAFLHWIIAGFYFHFGFGFLALILFLLTGISGALIKYLKGKKRKNVKYMHITLSVITMIAMLFHIIEKVIMQLFL